MAYIEVASGPGVGRRYPLTDDRTTIGRHPECQIILEQVRGASRQHCEIVRQGEDFFVRDLRSRNGTFHNNRIIGETLRLLDDGDIVRICNFEIPNSSENFKKRIILAKIPIIENVLR